jgi:hypothetical protein
MQMIPAISRNLAEIPWNRLSIPANPLGKLVEWNAFPRPGSGYMKRGFTPPRREGIFSARH